jgi:hypothetical protein
MDDHSSRRTVACTLQQPTRVVFSGTGRSSPLIWPCSSWGLPCRHRYRQRGALLPHLFTLARSDANAGRRRCFFCGTFRHAAVNPTLRCAQALPGSPPFGARTFLEQTSFAGPVSRSSSRHPSPPRTYSASPIRVSSITAHSMPVRTRAHDPSLTATCRLTATSARGDAACQHIHTTPSVSAMRYRCP